MRSKVMRRLGREHCVRPYGLLKLALCVRVMHFAIAPAYGGSPPACYNFVTVNSPNSPISRTNLTGLNNQGTYLGFAQVMSGSADALPLFYNGSAFTFPPAFKSDPYIRYAGINDSGIAVGNLNESCNASYPGIITYQAGAISQPTIPFAAGQAGCAYAVGITDGGAIIGNVSNTAMNQSWGFSYLSGTTTLISAPGATAGTTSLQAASANGTLLGSYFDASNNQHSFLDVNGNFSAVSLPANSYPLGVNSSGMIVGYFNLPAGSQGFVNTAGAYALIDYPGTSGATFVSGINDAGVIDGFYVSSPGVVNGFIGSPIAVNPSDPAPIAYDVAATTSANTYVQLDLGAGTAGSCVSAVLVGMPVGGTVSYLPATTIRFFPSANFTGPAGFQYYLTGPTGNSNIATASIAVLGTAPTYVPPSTKAELLLLSSDASRIANELGYASVAAEGSDNVATLAKKVAGKVAIDAAENVVIEQVSGNDALSAKGLEYMASVVDFTAKGLAGLRKLNPTTVTLDAAAIVFKLIAVNTELIANDPPDSNYTKIFKPQTYKLPSTGNPTVDGVITDYLNYTSLLAASLHSGERWQGATLAGSTEWETKQLAAFNKYFQEAAAAKAIVQTDTQTLAATLPSEAIVNFPGGASAIAAAFNHQCGQPLPANLNKLILGLGLAQPAIDAATCEVTENVTSAMVITNFAPQLTSPLP